MKKIILYAIISISLISSAMAGSYKVELVGDRLSIRADQVPLQNVLGRLVDMGITVHIDPGINPEITASFENREVRSGLDSILKSINHVLVWRSVEGPLKSYERLEEIHIFKPGERELAVRLKKRAEHIIKRNEKDGSLYTANEILLRLKPEVTLSEFKSLLRDIRGTVLEGNVAIGVYRIRLPENTDIPSLIDRIANQEGIAKAEPNYAYPIASPLWISNPGAASTSSLTAPYAPYSEAVAPVAVIDTGLAEEPSLSGYILASMDAINPDDDISDPLGHGTQMALIASGVIKPNGVNEELESYNPIISIRAFDDNGFVSNFDIMRSIDFSLKNKARVISLSWGSETKSDFLEDDLNYAVSKGLIIVASAGNEPTGKPVYPAAYRSIIGVGALGPDGKRWERSNYGDFVMIQAPGFASLPVGYKGDPGIYAGTSISAAFTANLIANYLSKNPDAGIEEVLNSLKKQ